MTISEIYGSAAATPTASTRNADGSATLADFDAFLNLFVSQLQNQDPLAPMENAEFLAQTAQFSSVEQLVSLNHLAEGLAGQLGSSLWSTAAALIGRRVEAVLEDSTGAARAAEGRVVAVDTDSNGDLVLGLADGTQVPLEAVVAVREEPTDPG
ncbi:MAG: flagellar hook capping FlgD N-terminal domain-containing protein [Deferrisomatales bacterium]|nr:flagellar hook capping FlgD N-terminal domain-containing protein [Deferrisomatales bacterium]